MTRGRRPGPGSEEEKAVARREKVRLNVQAFRRRQKGIKDAADDPPPKPALRWIEDQKWQTAYASGQQRVEEKAAMDKSSQTSSSFSASLHTPRTKNRGSRAKNDTPLLLMGPDQRKLEMLSLLSTFPSRFLPDRIQVLAASHMEDIRTPCALWVTTAYGLARDQPTGPLSDIVFAITTALASLELQRDDLQVVSRRFYQRGLHGTRKLLDPIIQNQAGLEDLDIGKVILACHAASVYEFYCNQSLADMNRHIQGVGILINHQRKFPGFPSLIGDSLLEEYRLIEIGFCLMGRRLSSVTKLTQVGLPPLDAFPRPKKPATQPGRGIFTTLLDIADYIPVAMVQIDGLKPLSPSPQRNRQILDSVQTLIAAQSHFEAWSKYLKYKTLSGSSPCSQDSIELIDNEIDVKNITSYELACSWMFCLYYEGYALVEAIDALTLVISSTTVTTPIPPVTDPGSFRGNLQDNPSSTVAATAVPSLIRKQYMILRAKLVNTTGKLAQLMQFFFQSDQGIIGRSLGFWAIEPTWSALEMELARLQTDDPDSMKDLNLDDDDEDDDDEDDEDDDDEDDDDEDDDDEDDEDDDDEDDDDEDDEDDDDEDDDDEDDDDEDDEDDDDEDDDDDDDADNDNDNQHDESDEEKSTQQSNAWSRKHEARKLAVQKYIEVCRSVGDRARACGMPLIRDTAGQ